MASRLPCKALRALLVSHSFPSLGLWNQASPSREPAWMLHPLRKRTTVAAPAADDGSGPGGHGTEQRGSRQRESHDNRNVTRSIDSRFRIRDHGIDPPFRLGRREPCGGGYLLDEISPVIAAYAAMAGGGHEDSSSLGPFRAEIHVLRSSRRAKQPVEFVAQQRFGGAGVCRSGGR